MPEFSTGSSNYPIVIPRTRVSLTLPEGFRIMPVNPGVIKDDEHMILVTELNPGNLYANARGFTSDGFKELGTTVFEHGETTVNGYHAFQATVGTNDPKLHSHMLIFGDSTFSVMLQSIHVANDPLGNRLRDIMLRTTYIKDLAIDPFYGVAFSLDTVSSSFKLAQYAANTYIFTPDGVDRSGSPVLITLTPTQADENMSPRKTMSELILTLGKHGMWGFMESDVREETTEGQVRRTVTGDLYFSGKKKFFMASVMMKEDIMLIVHGICLIEDSDHRVEIERFIASVNIR